ncbi:hypothetical protein [Variovorax sp. GB1P17]|uniref:hypothetical protein n=1 Tax=Variovorax sp. GB1P17 TaxID=3443740 RepID=UPI003F455CA0
MQTGQRSFVLPMLLIDMEVSVFADLTPFEFAAIVVGGYFLIVFLVLSLTPGSASCDEFRKSE